MLCIPVLCIPALPLVADFATSAVRADLIDKGEKQQLATWNYLWSFIKQADLFVSVRTPSSSDITRELTTCSPSQHPVKEFVPKVVMDNLPVVYMPRASAPPASPYSTLQSVQNRADRWRHPTTASTDPLDGLNKPIEKGVLNTYRHTFDSAVQVRLIPVRSSLERWLMMRGSRRVRTAARSTGTADTSSRSLALTRPR